MPHLSFATLVGVEIAVATLVGVQIVAAAALVGVEIVAASALVGIQIVAAAHVGVQIALSFELFVVEVVVPMLKFGVG